MNKFTPPAALPTKRLARTSFDNVKEFRQLLLLERWSYDRFLRGSLR
jgi:hypothetical protein